MRQLNRAERIDAIANLIDMLDMIDAETEDLEPETDMGAGEDEGRFDGAGDRRGGAGCPYFEGA